MRMAARPSTAGPVMASAAATITGWTAARVARAGGLTIMATAGMGAACRVWIWGSVLSLIGRVGGGNVDDVIGEREEFWSQNVVWFLELIRLMEVIKV